jgi:hypothetical protein
MQMILNLGDFSIQFLESSHQIVGYLFGLDDVGVLAHE